MEAVGWKTDRWSKRLWLSPRKQSQILKDIGLGGVQINIGYGSTKSYAFGFIRTCFLWMPHTSWPLLRSCIDWPCSTASSSWRGREVCTLDKWRQEFFSKHSKVFGIAFPFDLSNFENSLSFWLTIFGPLFYCILYCLVSKFWSFLRCLSFVDDRL